MHGKEERKIIYTVVLGSSKFGSELRIQLGEITQGFSLTSSLLYPFLSPLLNARKSTCVVKLSCIQYNHWLPSVYSKAGICTYRQPQSRKYGMNLALPVHCLFICSWILNLSSHCIWPQSKLFISHRPCLLDMFAVRIFETSCVLYLTSAHFQSTWPYLHYVNILNSTQHRTGT